MDVALLEIKGRIDCQYFYGITHMDKMEFIAAVSSHIEKKMMTVEVIE